MSQQRDPQLLVPILQLAYSGELAAAYAYSGHWHSLSDADERTQIEKIENEEWHRKHVGEMLRSLNFKPSIFREVRAAIIGRVLGLLCHFTGWLAPMADHLFRLWLAHSVRRLRIREYSDFPSCQRRNWY